jgi:ATP-binding protein involved in chromosome partitioning
LANNAKEELLGYNLNFNSLWSNKMSQVLADLTKQVLNPLTGTSLSDEGRIISLNETDMIIEVTYKRDGITPEKKREIEHSFKDLISEQYTKEKKVLIKTISEDSSDIVDKKTPENSAPDPAPAQVKTGHAAPAPKKQIENIKNIIAVSSCKGGVGKSTLAVNLALSLITEGNKVGLIDADIYGPSIPILLGARGKKPSSNGENKILPLESYGLKFLSFGCFIPEEDPVIWRGPMLGGILNQFLFDADWGELDYLIIDLPPGTGDMQLSMIQATDIQGTVIVSTPQTVALHDTRKGIKMFQKVNVPILGMVENMSYFVPEDMPEKKYYIFGKEGVQTACKSIGVDFLGEIPLLTEIRSGGDDGQPFMSLTANKGTKTWDAFSKMAKSIDQKLNSKEAGKSKGFLGRIFT